MCSNRTITNLNADYLGPFLLVINLITAYPTLAAGSSAEPVPAEPQLRHSPPHADEGGHTANASSLILAIQGAGVAPQATQVASKQQHPKGLGDRTDSERYGRSSAQMAELSTDVMMCCRDKEHILNHAVLLLPSGVLVPSPACIAPSRSALTQPPLRGMGLGAAFYTLLGPVSRVHHPQQAAVPPGVRAQLCW